MADVDLRRTVLTVQRSKGRSRILAIRDDLAEELRQYIRYREKILTTSGADDPMTLFIRRDGSALTVLAASNALRRLLRELGLKPLRGRSGARPYELRHNSEAKIIPSVTALGAELPALRYEEAVPVLGIIRGSSGIA
jgi:integrase/recombinase XerD